MKLSLNKKNILVLALSTGLSANAQATGLWDSIRQSATDSYHYVTNGRATATRSTNQASPQEMKETAFGFTVRVSSAPVGSLISSTNPVLMIEGKLFNRCREQAPEFRILKRDVENTDGTRGVAIEFQDPDGKMRDCQTYYKADNRICGSSEPCIDLSEFGDTRINMADYNSTFVTAYVGGEFVQFDPVVEYRDIYFRQRQAGVRRQQLYAEEAAPVVKRYDDILETCAEVPEQIDLKRRALEKKAQIPNAMLDGEWAIASKKIDEEEIRVIMSRVNASSAGELASLEASIAPLEVSNPELAVQAYLKIADKHARSLDTMGMSRALNTLRTAKGVSASPETLAQVEIREWDYKFERLKQNGASGSLHPMAAQQELQKVLYEMEQRRMQVCGNGTFASPEMCNALTKHYQQSVRDVQSMSIQGFQNRLNLNQMRRPNSVIGNGLGYSPVGVNFSAGSFPVPYMTYPMYGSPVMIQPLGTRLVPVYRGF